MENNVKDSWERLLNPEKLRSNLIVTSLFITAFELLKDSIIGRIRDFFTNGFNEKGWIISSDYKTKVLSLNKSPLYASLLWLQEMQVIDSHDIAKFEEIKNCRNKIVHEIQNYISQSPKIDPISQFHKIVELLNKIEKWWIINVEIPTNPDYDGQDIDEEEITPGKILLFRLLLDIALGSEEESKWYYQEFNKRKKRN